MIEMSPRYRLRIIAAATMTVALVGFSITLVFPYLALKLADQGYSRLYIGIATGIGGIANILVAPRARTRQTVWRADGDCGRVAHRKPVLDAV